MSANGPKIGGGYIDVDADLSNFDAAMNALPKKAAAKMDAAMKALQARARSTKLEIGQAYKSGDLASQQRLIPIYDNLKTKIAAVEAATIKQAQSLQAAARVAQVYTEHEIAQQKVKLALAAEEALLAKSIASQKVQAAREQAAADSAAEKALQSRRSANAQTVASTGRGMNDIWLDGQMAGQLDKVGQAGTKAGEKVRQGGNNGAMGLMILSQTIDDAQWGLSAIVNNMPQVGMAIGQALGFSSEKAMAFGGAMGIAAVAINTWVKNADHVKAIFGGSESEDVKELANQLTSLGDTARSVFASIVNMDKGFEWVSTTGKEAEAVTRQMEEREAAIKAQASRSASNRSAVSGVTGMDAEKQGAAFKAALAEYGGGDKLAGAIASKRISKAGIGALDRDEYAKREGQIRGGVDADVVAAMAGDRDAMKRLGMEAPELKPFLRKNAPGAKDARDKAAAKAKSDASTTAKSLDDTVGRDLLKNPDMGIPELWGKIKEAMEKAGYTVKEIVDQLPAVAKNLKSDIDGKVRERATKEGISDASARSLILDEAKAKDKAEIERGIAPLTQEAERLASAMTGSVGQSILSNGGISDEDLTTKVADALKKSGASQDKIDESASLIARKLRENVESQVQERALNDGVSEGRARGELLQEARDNMNRDAPKAEIMSTESYQAKLLIGALNSKRDDTPQKQLAQAEKTNKNLESMIKVLAKPKPGTYAVAAPGGR